MEQSKKSSSSTALTIGWILIVVLVAVGTYLLANPIEFRERSEEVQQFMIPVNEYVFIESFASRFGIQLIREGEIKRGIANVYPYIWPRSDRFAPHFHELVLVRTEEDAQGFPNNVVVAWPRNEAWWERFIYGINWAIQEDEDNVRMRYDGVVRWRPFGPEEFEQRFGFAYPITIDDIIKNFEQFINLYNALSPDRFFIEAFADQLIDELPPPNWQQTPPPHEPSSVQNTTQLDPTPPDLTAPQQQLLDKFNYAYNFYFQFNDIDSVKAKIDPTNPAYDPSYTDIVFFQTPPEAESLLQGTIAAWLPEENIATQFIHMIHSALSFTEDELDILGEVLREVITLEQFGLSYPLQPTDLVNNWEKVNELWDSLKPIEHYAIRAFALKE